MEKYLTGGKHQKSSFELLEGVVNVDDIFTFDQIEDALNQSAARQVTRASIKIG